MKLSLLMNSGTLICICILVYPIGIIEVTTSRKCFLLFFSSLHVYWPPSSWNTLVHTSWGDVERCEKCAFQLPKMRKNKISWNQKNKCVTDFYWQLGLRGWSIIIVITCWAHKIQKFTLNSIKIMRIWKFFVYK